MGYLVIALKVGERVRIGDAEVLISDFDRGKIDLAIQAPRHIVIERMQSFAEKEFKKNEPEVKHTIRPSKR